MPTTSGWLALLVNVVLLAGLVGGAIYALVLLSRIAADVKKIVTSLQK